MSKSYNYLPLLPIISNSRPVPSINSMLPSSKMAEKILMTSEKGIPKIPREF